MSLFTNAHTFCGGEEKSRYHNAYLGIKFQHLITTSLQLI